MKKKTILVAAIVVMLVAALVVGGTLAYFTDTKSADNTFTVGNVKIDLLESSLGTARMPVTSALRVRSSIPKMLSCGPKFLSRGPTTPARIKPAIRSTPMTRSKLTLPRIRVTVSSLLRDSLTTRCPMSRTLVPTMLISASA